MVKPPYIEPSQILHNYTITTGDRTMGRTAQIMAFMESIYEN